MTLIVTELHFIMLIQPNVNIQKIRKIVKHSVETVGFSCDDDDLVVDGVIIRRTRLVKTSSKGL